MEVVDLEDLQIKTDSLIQKHKQANSSKFWLSEKGAHYYVPVDSGEIHVIHFKPENPIGVRPIVFVPGWGGMPSGYQDVYEILHDRVELFYVETREKKSSRIRRRGSDFSLSQKAKDVVEVIDFFELNHRDYVLFGGCWGGAVIFQGMMDGIFEAPTVVTFDPMHRLWYPQWMLNTIPVIFPVFIIRLMKPLLRWLQMRKMKEPRQKERALNFIENAVMWKWKRAAYNCRKFEIFRI